MMPPDDRERRRRGRPRVEPKSSVSSWIPTRQLDELIAVARERRASVGAVIRVAITRALTVRRPPDP